MLQKSEYIWLDGELIPWDKAQVHILTHALHYGTGAYEGIRAYTCMDGTSAVFRLEGHIARLFESMKILGLTIPYKEKDVCAAVMETLKVNKLVEGYIRPIAFVGEGVMGLYPGDNPIRLAIAVWPWGAYLGSEALEKGICVKTSSFSRHHVNVTMTKAKLIGNYVNSVLAKMEVKKDGYDEALMLDVNGFVAEASGENIFIVRNGSIKTTPICSVLEGLTRDTVITLAREMGHHVIEQKFARDEVYISDEAFFSGTAAEITPIREVDNRILGKGTMGSVTKSIQEMYFRVVRGQEEKYKKWLTSYTC